MSSTFRALGAAGEVTGSKHLIDTGDARILVDCGAFQGRRAEADEKNRALLGDIPPESIDAVVLTHAHYDHCGLLPYLVKKGFTGNIYSTSATRDLANLIMMDSAHIQARDADYLGRKAATEGKPFAFKPLYDDLDVVKTMEHFVTINYHRPMTIANGVAIEFYDAGHILGSSLVRFTLAEPGGKICRIGFSGDLGRKGKPIIRDPEPMPEVDYLVLESTYGNRLHESTSDAIDKLANVISETARRGGKVVIPAFAVERTQELIFILHLLLDAGRIPDIPIWVDSPMAIDATGIFKLHPECYDAETHKAFTVHSKNPFGFSALHFSSSVEDSKALNVAKGPMIIISADGMCEFGRIQHHLMHTLSDARNSILIVGYMADGTLGRRLKEGALEAKIHGDIFPVRASITSLDAFSAHADWRETLDWLSGKELGAMKNIFLVHGEDAAMTALSGHLQDSGARKVTPAQVGVSYPLASA